MRRLTPGRGPLRGTARVPGDKSISHRAALLAPLAGGDCRARGWLRSADTLATLEAVGLLGADAALDGDDLRVSRGEFPGIGPYGGAGEKVHVDCRNSGTTARLLCGLVAGRDVRVELDGDASLRGRPMARVADPLRGMGAEIEYGGDAGRLPLEIRGAALHGGDVRLPKPSAQIKSALLLAALSTADGIRLSGCGASRDHTERMLAAMGADLETGPEDGGSVVLRPGRPLDPVDITIPGDPSSAAFLVAAALLRPGSELRIPAMGLNPTRTGFLDVLGAMGAEVAVENRRDASGEPVGDLTVRAGDLRAVSIEAAQVPTLIDELPILSVLAARAEGTSTIRGASELRVKESDRIAATAVGLRALGVTVEEYPDGLDIVGRPDWGRPGRVTRIATRGDHRLAMAFATAALGARGEVELDDDACIGVSFPGFFETLDSLKE